LGKCAYIDVLEVHRSYRRRGIGRALVDKAIEIAREHNCDTIAVCPDKEAIEFYRKCGIRKAAYNIVHLEIDLKKTKPKERNTYKIRYSLTTTIFLRTWNLYPLEYSHLSRYGLRVDGGML